MRGFARLLLLLTFPGVITPVASEAAAADLGHPHTSRALVLKRLVAKATPDALATAALVKQYGEEGDTGSYDLAARAAELAPGRRDLAWLAIRLCGRATDCDPGAAEQHLRKIDPGNGVVLIRALTHAQAIDDVSAIDAVLSTMANSDRFYVYFDPLVAATTPELAAARQVVAGKPGDGELASAGQEMLGVVAASILPPSQALELSCKGTALESVGRLDLCRRVAKAAEGSDTFIMEGLALSLQQRLWPLDSAEGRAINARRRVLQYRLEEYGRLSIAASQASKFPVDLVEVYRAHEREQDAALVYFAKAGIPTDPPANWTSTMMPRVP
jgi:hypothetical protein